MSQRGEYRSKQGQDADLHLDLETGKLRYRFATRKGGVDQFEYFARDIQRFIYYVHKETEDTQEVLERLCKSDLHIGGHYRTGTLDTIIRRITRSLRDFGELPEREKAHWNSVVSQYVPSTKDIENGESALLKRVSHETDAKGGIIVQYAISGSRNAISGGGPYISFREEVQAFIFTAVVFASLTSGETIHGLLQWISWSKRSGDRLKNRHVLAVARYIKYKLKTDRTDHWRRVSQPRKDILEKIRSMFPGKEIPQIAPAHVAPQETNEDQPLTAVTEQFRQLPSSYVAETQIPVISNPVPGTSWSLGYTQPMIPQSPYQGQHLPAGTTRQGYPQSPYVNVPPIPASSQQVPGIDWDLGSTDTARQGYPQSAVVNRMQTRPAQQPSYQSSQYVEMPPPAAQPKYSHAPGLDPNLSHTAALTHKRHAAHALDSGSSDSRPSSSSSKSSRDRPPQGHSRHGSTAEGSRLSQNVPPSRRREPEKPKSRGEQTRIALQHGSQAQKRFIQVLQEGDGSATGMSNARRSVSNLVQQLVNELLDSSQHFSQSRLSKNDEAAMLVELNESAAYYVKKLPEAVKDARSAGLSRDDAAYDMMGRLVDAQNEIKNHYERYSRPLEHQEEVFDAPFIEDDGPYLNYQPRSNEQAHSRSQRPRQTVQRPPDERRGQSETARARNTGQEQSRRDRTSISRPKKRHEAKR